MDELDEKVLTIQQRQKRAQELRRNEVKLKVARERAKKKIAPEENIKKRAFAMARQLIRSRYANVSEAEYEKMGPSEKMTIDRLIEKKGKAIKKLALRLIPKVKKAEYARLQSYMHGRAMANLGAPEGNHVSEELNNLFVEYFGDSAPGNSGSTGERSDNPITSSGRKTTPKQNGKAETAGNAKGGTKTKGSPIVQYGKFGEDLEVESSEFKGLVKKADKSGIDLELLGEVYNRGLDAWVKGYNVTPTQYAFARVNSYINQGRTYFNEDADLHEAMTSWSGKGLLSKMRAANKAFKRGAAGWEKDMHDVSTVKAATKSLSPEQKMATLNAKAGKGSPLELQQKLIKRELRKEELELQEDEAPFKKGETLYLKTKKFANSPHSGQVVRVTPTHVHLKTLGGTGMYKAPHSSVTRDYKESHLHRYHSEVKNKIIDEEIEITESKFVAHVSKDGKSHGTIRLSAIDQENAEWQLKNHPKHKHYTIDKIVKEETEINESDINSVFNSHNIKNIRSDGKTFRGKYEMRGSEANVTKLVNRLKNTGWKEHNFTNVSTPRQDINGHTYWSGHHKFSHPEHGTIHIPGTVTASGKTFDDKTRAKEYGSTVYYSPKKKKIVEVFTQKEDLEESKNTPYVKPHKETYQKNQTGWKASNKHGHVKYFGLPFKKAAEKHAYGVTNEETNLDEMAGANMDRRALVSHITSKGWQKKASGGSGDHDVFTHPKSTHRLAVPRHNKLKAPLILDVLKKSKIMDKTNEEVESVDEHIVKVKSGYRLVSKSSGKNLGTYPTKEGAEKRERQVQYFKHQNEEVELDEIQNPIRYQVKIGNRVVSTHNTQDSALKKQNVLKAKGFHSKIFDIKTVEEVELDEVLSSTFKKTEKFGGKDLGRHISTIEGAKHIGTMENGHEVYHSYDPKDKMHDYHVVDPKTKRINIHLETKQQKAPGAEEVSVLTANNRSLGAHHLYQHLVTKHNKIISSNDQSPGARKVWANVGKHRGINIHGYDPISKTTFHMKPTDDEEYTDRDNKEVNTIRADRKLTAPRSKDRAAHDAELEDLDRKKYTYIVMHKKGNLKEDLESYLSELTLPKGYIKGLTSAEIKAKKAHIERNSKLSDRDPDAYKDMPGDKRIREKGIPQSKYTKAYHAKFGESVESLDEDALADKAKKSGISLGTLKKVYRRGVAAWNSGHRPGTTPQQWGMARVNSYITKGKTYHTADKDLHEDDTCMCDRPISVARGKESRKKTQNVERDLTPETPSNDAAHPKNPASDAFKQQQIKKKIIDEASEKITTDPNKPTSRLIGTDSLVKTYKKATPGQNLDEAFNIAFAAGIGQTYTAADLGMRMKGGFEHHPSVVEEDVVSAEKAPVVVPAHKDAYGNVIPAKTVMRKLNRKIIKSGNVHNGDTDQPIGDPNNG